MPIKKFVIKTAPLSLLEPDAGVELGIELRTSKRISLENDFTYIFIRHRIYDRFEDFQSSYYDGDNYKNKYRGFGYKLELRLLIATYASMSGLYFATQFNYKHVKWIETMSNRQGSFEDEKFKDIYQVNFKFGFQHIFEKGIAFDFFGGAGLKYRITESSQLEEYYSRNLSVTAISTMREEDYFPAFTGGLKIGWGH